MGPSLSPLCYCERLSVAKKLVFELLVPLCIPCNHYHYYNSSLSLLTPLKPYAEDHLDELFILNLTTATAKCFFSGCCEELTLVSNNSGDEEVRERDWKELYLEKLCLCIALEDAVPSLRIPDTFTTATSSPHTPLKRRACKLLVSLRHSLLYSCIYIYIGHALGSIFAYRKNIPT